jgi:radical SAM protein with 4Fe4S-binding SPASM domain
MTGFCLGLRDQLAILVDGTVVPCCLDAQGGLALGNIRDQALSDILQGTRAKAIYDGFSKRTVVEELCRKCGYRTRFDLIQKSR